MNDVASGLVLSKHFTRPQLLSLIIEANTEVAEINRGGGKTEKILAPWLMRRAYAMPRALGGLVSPSYKKLFSELMPAIYAGWDDIGYIQDKHYTVRKCGPAKWHKPFKRFEDWSNAIHLSCGSGIAVISQDRPTMGVGLTLDFLAAEETRLLDGQSFMNRLRQAMRGNSEKFGHLSCHHSMLLVTDKGETTKQRWYQRFKQEVDEQAITYILQLYYERQKLENAIDSGSLSPRTIADYRNEIDLIDQTLNRIRKTTTFYNTGTAIDNIEFIGWENFKRMERTMDPAVFARSMMNEDVDFVVGAWYSGFDADKHCYQPVTASFTLAKDGLPERGYRMDSRHDAEISPNGPLDIAMDYGGKFNCMAVGQMFKDLFRIDHGFHAFHPDTTQDVVQQFCDYYQHHKRKEVYYYWDHTAKDRHGTSRFLYHETVRNTLRENGWHVHSIEIGHTPRPPQRREMFAALFKEETPSVLWNADGCSDMIQSMKLTRIKEGRRGIEKNKNDEDSDDPKVQLHAPHYSDAVDTLVWGRLEALGTHAPPPVASLFT